MSNPIHIIGAGAIGRALAVALQHHGKDVTLVRATAHQGEATRERLRLLPAGPADEVIEHHVSLIPLGQIDHFNGPVVIASKSYGNPTLAQTLRLKVGDNPIVLLQNGLGVEQPFLEHHYPNIFRCVLFITSQLTDQGIRLKPVAPSLIGVVGGDQRELNTVVSLLNTSIFAFAATDKLQEVVWKKVIANSVFNSICPLLEVDNGLFHRQSEARALAARVVAECVQVAQGLGISITQEEVMNTILHISRSSDGQFISTLQDIRAKRETEIDTLNFEIARIADTLGLTPAVITTRLLGELVKLKSQLQ